MADHSIHLADIVEEPSDQDSSEQTWWENDEHAHTSESKIITDGGSNEQLDEVNDHAEGVNGKEAIKNNKSKKAKQIDEDELYDTDLDANEEDNDYRFKTQEEIYLDACEHMGVVPASYFLRHMNDKVVYMPHHGLGPKGTKALVEPLFANTQVLVLNLEGNWIESEGAQHIAEMLKENCYITELNIANNRLKNKGAEAICEILRINSSLEVLNLSGNIIKDSLSPILATAVLENNILRVLDLSHNSLGKMAAQVLAHAIGENETLENLDLSWNNFSGRSGSDLMDAIRVNSRLKSVNVSWNGFGDTSSASVAECLRTNHVLTELDISSNRLSEVGVAAIAKGLDVNEDLKVLKIGYNPMGSTGASALLNAINNDRSTLLELDLKDVFVEKQFNEQHQTLLESRPKLSINHAGILSNYILKSLLKSAGGKGAANDGGENVTVHENM